MISFVNVHKFPLKGCMSKNVDLGLSFDFMSKTDNFWYIFKIFSKYVFLHFIKVNQNFETCFPASQSHKYLLKI